MRISDWSSDVCSSDLHAAVERGGQHLDRAHADDLREQRRARPELAVGRQGIEQGRPLAADREGMDVVDRSEERRVGKECVSTCRTRWSPDHEKKNTEVQTPQNTTQHTRTKKHQ